MLFASLPKPPAGVVGKPEFITYRVYWRNDRTIYRRRATAGNRGGIPYETGLLIFGVSIALYTAFGGFRASVPLTIRYSPACWSAR